MSDSFGVGNDNNEVIMVDNDKFLLITKLLLSQGWSRGFNNNESFAMRYFLNGVEKSKDEYFNEFKKAYEKVTKS
jgi:hypothetical protein